MGGRLSAEDLKRLFVRAAASRSYFHTVTDVEKLLVDGPPGRSPDSKLKDLQHRYLSLSREEKRLVSDIVKYTAELSGFSIMVLLDNLAGGRYAENCIGNIRLIFLPEAGSEEKVETPQSHRGVAINESSGENLHDMFLEECRGQNSQSESGTSSVSR